jgi:hypothetical protein
MLAYSVFCFIKDWSVTTDASSLSISLPASISTLPPDTRSLTFSGVGDATGEFGGVLCLGDAPDAYALQVNKQWSSQLHAARKLQMETFLLLTNGF